MPELIQSTVPQRHQPAFYQGREQLDPFLLSHALRTAPAQKASDQVVSQGLIPLSICENRAGCERASLEFQFRLSASPIR